ncbi:uncharacterized protein OCT59_005672 [Rhizophagus irregularis]|nr:hypothetical protein OCT59_005672 [Rhizophagus irregularis]GBC37670.1 Gti1/Pac2 family-domain-containing protein [Rhizophagus irregularis DAOM 181602=DAOM 197198]CAB4495711.1 unnamed protein product [Rhizophagus irregularis]CAB5176057.1 unnamed protein product [Rhizophagus irregularis]
METFHGRITSTKDALIIFEACRQGVLCRTTRRMVEDEKKILRAGSVYVYDEAESGIKRWTDGKIWSPSKIVGDFLVYQELEMRFPFVKSYDKLNKKTKQRIKNEDLKVQISAKGTFIHRKIGLSKKTITVKLNDSLHHMIIYEDKEGSHNFLYSPCAYVQLLTIEPGVDLVQNEALRRHKVITYNDRPSPKLNKVRGSGDVDMLSPIAVKNECDEKAVDYSISSSTLFTIPPIRSVSLTQTLPANTEALYYVPIQALQETSKVDVSEATLLNVVNLSQENNQQTSTNSDLESVQLIVDGINILQNNGHSLPFNILPAYATVAVRDTAVPNTTVDAVNSDFFGLVDFSRL